MASASGLFVIIGIAMFSSLDFAPCHGAVLTFSDLQRSLLVSASPRPQQGVGTVLRAGEDQITVTCALNQSFTGANTVSSTYKTIKVKLCYAPISQVDRPWRKTVNTNLAKDKTCQYTIISRPYNSGNNTFTWTITRDVPTATYFVRAYAYNADGTEVTYGQTTNANKTTNLFEVQGISGRNVSLGIASTVFSGFSLFSLFGFFYLEKRKTRKTPQDM
ncbi:High-affinity nitrate transporter 3.2-like protein [Drosera capensis]